MQFIKAHAYGNDFVIVPVDALPTAANPSTLAQRICDRHRGIGADGLMLATVTDAGAAMRLFNADGSYSELSGNGVRCLAAWVAQSRLQRPGAVITIQTDAGDKRLWLLERDGQRFDFRAAMGAPEDVRQTSIDLAGDAISAVVLRVGNPQCVVLGPATEARLHAIAGPLAVHPTFPHGTNVELAAVETPDRVRILIWERGVGPTEASGTGACAAAVAAAAFGGASRVIDVVSPGGTQRVEWTDRELWLTGSAEIIATGEFS